MPCTMPCHARPSWPVNQNPNPTPPPQPRDVRTTWYCCCISTTMVTRECMTELYSVENQSKIRRKNWPLAKFCNASKFIPSNLTSTSGTIGGIPQPVCKRFINRVWSLSRGVILMENKPGPSLNRHQVGKHSGSHLGGRWNGVHVCSMLRGTLVRSYIDRVRL